MIQPVKFQGKLKGVEYEDGHVVSVQVEDTDGEVYTFIKPTRSIIRRLALQMRIFDEPK